MTQHKYTVVGPPSPSSSGEQQQPQRRLKGVALKMAAALFLVIGGYVTFTLVSEGEAVQQSSTGYSTSYLPDNSPKQSSLAAMFSSPHMDLQKSFQHVAGDEGRMTLDNMKLWVQAAAHGALLSTLPPPDATVGPTAPFFATVRKEVGRVSLSAPVVLGAFFNASDTDHDGYVTFSEVMLHSGAGIAFVMADANHDGEVTAAELVPLVTDAAHGALVAAQQATEVLADGVLAITENMVSLAAMFAPAPITADVVWQLMLAQPGAASSLSASMVSMWPPQADAHRVMALNRVRDGVTDFDVALAEAGTPAGLDLAAFTAFCMRDKTGSWASNPDVQEAWAMMTSVVGVPGAQPAPDAATSLRGQVTTPTLGTQAVAVLDSMRQVYTKEMAHLAYSALVLLDHNHDERVSAEEYHRMTTLAEVLLADPATMEPLDRARQLIDGVINLMDGNHDGAVSKAEMQAAADGIVKLLREVVLVATNLGLAALPHGVPLLADTVVAVVDADQSGGMSLQEVATAMAALAPAAAALPQGADVGEAGFSP